MQPIELIIQMLLIEGAYTERCYNRGDITEGTYNRGGHITEGTYNRGGHITEATNPQGDI